MEPLNVTVADHRRDIISPEERALIDAALRNRRLVKIIPQGMDSNHPSAHKHDGFKAKTDRVAAPIIAWWNLKEDRKPMTPFEVFRGLSQGNMISPKFPMTLDAVRARLARMVKAGLAEKHPPLGRSGYRYSLTAKCPTIDPAPIRRRAVADRIAVGRARWEK